MMYEQKEKEYKLTEKMNKNKDKEEKKHIGEDGEETDEENDIVDI